MNFGVLLGAGGALAAIASIPLDNPLLAGIGMGALFYAGASWLAFDRSARKKAGVVRCLSAKKAPVGGRVDCTLGVAGPALPIEFSETLPSGMRVVDGSACGKGFGGGEAEYGFVSSERGLRPVGPAALRIADGTGLFEKREAAGEADEVLFYPSLGDVKKYDMQLRRRRANTPQGVRRTVVQGAGTEFSSLRKYVPGDELRQIDWKATARTRQLIVKTFEEEKRQRVVIALDCGKRMDAGDDGTMLDAGVNAAVLLANAVLRRGDALGFAAFSDRLEAFVKPGSGKERLYEVLNALAKLKPERETDFVESFRALTGALPKRSLIIIISCLQDGGQKHIIEAVKLLKAHKHAVVVIAPFEPWFEHIEGDEMTAAIAAGAEEKYLSDLNHIASELKRFGAVVLPAGPADVAGEALGAYVHAVNRGLATV